MVGTTSESNNITRKLDQTPTWVVAGVCSLKEKGGSLAEERKVRDGREAKIKRDILKVRRFQG